ncbi:DUF4383 domain-containing protein [Pedomonas mirosovicensis]|uniref:DUF4383 domain-containing protein n=1 Tax=Pedomonas mirosovicensis TaxID=2908641 RepID=UPI0021676764|nr:DUF4383 domain-containing protein [Pedomonas mirosovicensis]MCH8685855.1 DUF4383 domain-containing protein [Pedomonas mirosovicensis]
MNTRSFALIFGILFLAAGIAGFIPALMGDPDPDHPAMIVDQNYGRLFNILPVNILHNLVHIVFGLWGLLAYRTFSAARLYARVVAVSYAILALFGLIPGLNTLFGLVPLFSNDVWFHALLAVIAAYFGFIHNPREDRQTAYPDAR